MLIGKLLKRYQNVFNDRINMLMFHSFILDYKLSRIRTSHASSVITYLVKDASKMKTLKKNSVLAKRSKSLVRFFYFVSGGQKTAGIKMW